jgi:SAM-dependent methyltransferase
MNVTRIEETDRVLFDRIARDYARKDLTESCRVARRHRLAETLRRVGSPLGHVLEIGCGAGFSASYLDGQYASYTGVDYSAELIRYARQYNAGAGRAFECANARDYAPGRRFDVILLIGVLHHMPETVGVLTHLRTLLAPGGAVVANEPQRGNVAIGAMRWLRKRVDPSYSADQVEFSEGELRDLFRRAGYVVEAWPQGVASTPFAETRPFPAAMSLAFARAAVRVDPWIERSLQGRATRRLAWNVVVVGRSTDSWGVAQISVEPTTAGAAFGAEPLGRPLTQGALPPKR